MKSTGSSETSDVNCAKCGEPIENVICSTPLGPMHRLCFDEVYEIYPTFLPISGCFDAFKIRPRFNLAYYLLAIGR